MYRYDVRTITGRHVSVVGVITFSLLLGFFIVQFGDVRNVNAETDTQTVAVNGDYGTNNDWASNSGASDSSCAGGTQCDYIDESGETDYVNTGTGGSDLDEEEYDFLGVVVRQRLIAANLLPEGDPERYQYRVAQWGSSLAKHG